MPKVVTRKTKGQWDSERLKLTLQEIREGKIGIKQASKAYGIPKSTLQDRLTSNAEEGLQKPGRKTVL